MSALSGLQKARKELTPATMWAGDDWKGKDDNACCVSLAIGRFLAPCGPSWWKAHRLLAAELGVGVVTASQDQLEAIYNWNDAPERTHAEVLAAFDRAIATAEAA